MIGTMENNKQTVYAKMLEWGVGTILMVFLKNFKEWSFKTSLKMWNLNKD